MKRQPKIDAGVQDIAAWHSWFVASDRQRLADANLSADEYARELGSIVAIGATVAERIKDDYLRNRAR